MKTSSWLLLRWRHSKQLLVHSRLLRSETAERTRPAYGGDSRPGYFSVEGRTGHACTSPKGGESNVVIPTNEGEGMDQEPK